MESTEYAPSSFAEHVEQHSPFLLRYVRARLADRSLAEDIVQESFLRLYEANQWQAVKSPRAYLLIVARNLIVDQYRLASHRTWSLGFADPPDGTSKHHDGEPDYLRHSSRLDAALARLPWKHKRILELHYLQGQTYEAIGRELNMTATSVKVMSLRARRAVRKNLEQRCSPALRPL